MGSFAIRAFRAPSSHQRWRFPLSVLQRGLLLAGLLCFSLVAQAETPPDPLAVEEKPEGGDMALRIWRLRSADLALQMGFSSLAASGYRALLEAGPNDEARITRIELSLASALISEGQFDEAQAVLDRVGSKEKSPAFLLRQAILDWQARRWQEVDAFLAEVEAKTLSATDRGWYFFLKGLAADHAKEEEAAEAAYVQALKEAVSPSQRAEFVLGQYQTKLFAGEASEELAAELKKQMGSFEGRTAGFRFAQQYAIVLDLLGKKEEATQVIRDQIKRVPAADKELRDQFLLLDGLISGSKSGQGRESLRELLETGGKRSLQQIALQKLASNVTEENNAFFADLLTRLIKAEHSLQEELHLYRAQVTLRQAVAMQAGDERTEHFERAAADAELILTRFPGSRLKLEALEVLAASAWEQRRYRTAANHLTRLREELPTAQRRGEVGLLIADCYFRAGEVNRAVEDYRNAADAYGTVLREHPDSISPGLLLYQRVLSEIRGGRLEEVSRHLNELPEGVKVEPIFRWQAEWNLVKAMQERGQMTEAYTRVTNLLSGKDAEAIPTDDLRLRLEWLQAQLSFDAGKPEETIPLAEKVLGRVQGESAPDDGELRDRITSYSLLLQGQAQLAVGQTDAALARFKEVRERFPESDPATYSFLVEARYYTRVNRTVDAQQLLTSLADSHKNSKYAPIALYEAALNAQRRGQESSYQDQAIALLERLVDEYPGHELAFYARLHQGDLLRQLNRFEAAEVVYLSIENNYPDHPDILLVQLSLADCYLAQAGRDERQRFQNAVSVLERLLDLPTANADLRAEAGFKLAFANAARGEGERAQQVYWTTVASLYLDEKVAATLGSRGRYWISRCLFENGQQFEREGRLEQAREAYAMIKEGGLPGESLAAANLARLVPKENIQ